MKERWNRNLLRVQTEEDYYEDDPDNPFDFGDHKEESDRAYRHHRTKMGFVALFFSVMLFTLFLLLLLVVATLADLK
jgi:hypothetical protein